MLFPCSSLYVVDEGFITFVYIHKFTLCEKTISFGWDGPYL